MRSIRLITLFAFFAKANANAATVKMSPAATRIATSYGNLNSRPLPISSVPRLSFPVPRSSPPFLRASLPDSLSQFHSSRSLPIAQSTSDYNIRQEAEELEAEVAEIAAAAQAAMLQVPVARQAAERAALMREKAAMQDRRAAGPGGEAAAEMAQEAALEARMAEAGAAHALAEAVRAEAAATVAAAKIKATTAKMKAAATYEVVRARQEGREKDAAAAEATIAGATLPSSYDPKARAETAAAVAEVKVYAMAAAEAAAAARAEARAAQAAVMATSKTASVGDFLNDKKPDSELAEARTSASINITAMLLIGLLVGSGIACAVLRFRRRAFRTSKAPLLTDN